MSRPGRKRGNLGSTIEFANLKAIVGGVGAAPGTPMKKTQPTTLVQKTNARGISAGGSTSASASLRGASAKLAGVSAFQSAGKTAAGKPGKASSVIDKAASITQKGDSAANKVASGSKGL